MYCGCLKKRVYLDKGKIFKNLRNTYFIKFIIIIWIANRKFELSMSTRTTCEILTLSANKKQVNKEMFQYNISILIHLDYCN